MTGVQLQPTVYQGQGANGVRIPTARDGTKNEFQSQSPHTARVDLVEPVLKWANWYCTLSNPPVETNAGGAATLEASIKYRGVWYPLTSGGVAAATASDGGFFTFDKAAGLTIKAGSAFLVRCLYKNAAGGVLFTDHGYAGTLFNCFESGTTGQLTNKLTSGAAIGTGSVYSYPPCAILTDTSAPSFAFVGNSRGWGNNDTADMAGDIGTIARAVGRAYGYVNLCSPGERLSNLVAGGAAKRLALLTTASHVIVCDAVNDLKAGRTKAQILADYASLKTMVGDKFFGVMTTNPNTTTTDGGATEANQTVDASESIRLSLNSDIRAGISAADAVYDATPLIENGGKWKAGLSPDGLHESNAACLMIRDSYTYPPQGWCR